MSRSSFSILKAHKAQALLCRKIVQEDRIPERIKLVAGVDAAYFNERAIGAVAVLDYENMKIV
jgi:deoxyinosine 3'endonuclease (endonuclease V)